jgi:hypothetical protein
MLAFFYLYFFSFTSPSLTLRIKWYERHSRRRTPPHPGMFSFYRAPQNLAEARRLMVRLTPSSQRLPPLPRSLRTQEYLSLISQGFR